MTEYTHHDIPGNLQHFGTTVTSNLSVVTVNVTMIVAVDSTVINRCCHYKGHGCCWWHLLQQLCHT